MNEATQTAIKAWRRDETVYECEHEGCHVGAIQCHLVDYGDFKSPPKDVYRYYCGPHCQEEGFCFGCGEFWAGVKSFDAGNGLCDNCNSELTAELESEFVS